jgi:Mn-containing catalase
MQYSVQGLNCEDPDRKDLLMDIGTEELSHLEIVGSFSVLASRPSTRAPALMDARGLRRSWPRTAMNCSRNSAVSRSLAKLVFAASRAAKRSCL